jgi:phosphomannomutase
VPDLRSVVKAYDVRGIVPDELDDTVAYALGAATVDILHVDELVTAHDMRDSGPPLADAFAAGATSRGARVLAAGLASTDMLYFASGRRDRAGAMFTASHNPARYNGVKICRPGAVPVGADTGLIDIRDRAQGYLDQAPDASAPGPSSHPIEVLADYARYLRSLVDLHGIRPLRVVVDAGNGMAGYTVPAVLGDAVLDALPLEIHALYFELDGTFPNHEANPLDPANLLDLQAAVVEHGADIGLAFDGDADHCFVIDETGAAVSPSAVTALVATRELARHPGATILHNLISSRAVPEIVREQGGHPVRTRVGHSYIKAEMARTGAVFGGEHSAHYYFQDFWRADTGMLAAMHVLAALGEQPLSLSALTARYERYASSGEINSKVADADAQADRSDAVRSTFAERTVATDDLDGLTLDLADGTWLNVRGSNTEPLLRLNVEGPDAAAMRAVRDEALAVIRATTSPTRSS